MAAQQVNQGTAPPGEAIVARIGLISDTHMPQRCAALPDAVFDALEGVDLILHAGDVGELWVLDHLSTIAPVVAVHGNDETEEAQRELPYQQLVTVAGQRVLLRHSHHQDRAEELASRGRSWHQILDRLAERGRRSGARVVVFGHAHVPLTYQHGDVHIVNPGALASGHLFTRQRLKTVALLSIVEHGTPVVTHVDLVAPQRTFVPAADWEAPFSAAFRQTQAPIVEKDLLDAVTELMQQTYRDMDALVEAVLPLCHPCWSDPQLRISRSNLLDLIRDNAAIASADREKGLAILSGAR